MSTSSVSVGKKIPTSRMERILDMLKCHQNRELKKRNYLAIWQQFNNFIVHLDKCPAVENCESANYEYFVSLYCAHLADQGIQSATIKSYVSAIKNILTIDGYKWCQEKVCLDIVVRACRLKNDQVQPRLPIHFGLLEMLLFEIERLYAATQPYLCTMYIALFSLAYYGLMRISEITGSVHLVRAQDTHIGSNKKVLLLLYSSKMHGKESPPQKIKISESETSGKKKKFFCPFKALRHYLAIRGPYADPKEQLFILVDKLPIPQSMLHNILRVLLQRVNLDPYFYSFQSMRAGRATDLFAFGYPVELIKRIGRWKSNAIYKYLKD